MFKIKQTIGRDHAVDLQDIPPTKQALMRLGFYDVPSYGMNTYPDEAMFDGIERFQAARGLRKDGVMKPGGETERAFAHALARKGSGSPGQLSAKSGNCPNGHSEVIEPICIPGTNICWHRKRCIPSVGGGGRRA